MFEHLFSKISHISQNTGDKIRAVRCRHGMTVRGMAAHCGISPTGMRQYEENSRKVSDTKMQKIADAMGVSVESLAEHNIHSVADFMHILFEVESDYQLRPVPLKDPREFAIVTTNEAMIAALQQWALNRPADPENAEQLEQYETWKETFPARSDELPLPAQIQDFYPDSLPPQEIQREVDNTEMYDTLRREDFYIWMAFMDCYERIQWCLDSEEGVDVKGLRSLLDVTKMNLKAFMLNRKD